MEITFVFYEYPKALHEIKAWSEALRDGIEQVIVISDNRFIYDMKNGERLHIYPNNAFDVQEVASLCCIKHPYKKTLLFGKFEAKQLEKVLSVMNSVEVYKIQA